MRRSNCCHLTVLSLATTVWMVACPPLLAQECQNQFEIDVCKAGCTATSAVCGALCDFTSGACWVGCQAAFGACDVGCGACHAACDVCCFFGTCNCNNCHADCNACQADCDNARAVCEGGCRLDCDNCIFNCERDCESICRPFRTVGEFCIPVFDRCADGLVCWPLPFPGELRPRCFPDESDDPLVDDACRKLYSSALHQGAIDTGVAMTYGAGSAFSAVLSITSEQGVVYGSGGEFGCYVSSCVGAVSNAGVGVYAAVGFSRSYADVKGQSINFSASVGEIIGFANSQIINLDGEYVGSADTLGFEVGVLPFALGVYDCVTVVDTVGMRNPADGALVAVDNSPPTAICDGRELCADALTCTADVNIDLASIDPDGDALFLQQHPPAPYSLGETHVVLTARDPSGDTDSCSARVVVNDCTPPRIADVKLTPNLLWPPNDRLYRVYVGVDTADACDSQPTCRIVDLESSGSGRWSDRAGAHPDMDIIDAVTVELRADRRGEHARTYTVIIECTDSSGNSSRGSAVIHVGHAREDAQDRR